MTAPDAPMSQPLISTTFGKTFPQNKGQTVLDAAMLAGIALPYSCKTGRCSTCKCRVLQGDSIAHVDELGLTPEEKTKGWILSCVRSATSDLAIDIEDLSHVAIPAVRTLPARINSIEKLAPDVLGVKLRLPPSSELIYLAGQYIDVIGPGGIRRSYSLASAPASNNALELHIRCVPGGAMSDYWFTQAKSNDLVRLNGPMGSFFLRKLAGLHLVFLATGTGIAPVKAMLESLNACPAEDQPLSITLYWGGREPQDLYDDPSPWHPHLKYVPVLSRATSNGLGVSGYVQHAMLSQAPDLGNTVVYACGSNAMIQSAKTALTEAGLDEVRFYSDAFVCSATT
jgi:CDP-4-dehydro-6-deoxyglucose reductase